MPTMHAFGALATALCALIASSPRSLVSAAPVEERQSSSYWVSDITRQGTAWGNGDPSYSIYRNVMDYGAKGDGSTDDTAAINAAIADGDRCGQGCESTTTSPAIIYFPAGTYIISTPIIMYYYTQMIGDALDLPTIKGSSSFEGIALIDSDPYDDTGDNWWTNQNNFFRQVRNFNIDLTGMEETTGAGIHWQVAQATSLQNMNFIMHPASSTNAQIGIFMDNGSGGFFGDLTFTGGNYGAFLGNQQFTSRNLVFSGCNTAIFMNWNWGWTFSNVSIDSCGVGFDMSNSPTNETVGSVVLSDSSISNTEIGIQTAWLQDNNVPVAGDTLILDNVLMTSVSVQIGYPTASNNVTGTDSFSSYAAGNGYMFSNTQTRAAGSITAPTKNAALLDSTGKIYGRSRPQYETYSSSQFLSAKSSGCKGDGSTDDTAAIQAFLTQAASAGQIAYFDHGAYIVTDTIIVPAGSKITGEIWPLIVASGFTDMANPKPVFQLGNSGESGDVEISDIIFETLGANPGAIMVQWELDSPQGGSGMWDSHARIGGTYGTELESTQCPTNLDTNDGVASCEGVFLMFYAPSTSSGVYLENTWFWVADHELDIAGQTQISIYSARGVLIKSQGPVWLWGTASEHSIMYNYQFDGVTALFSGFMQSETPYFQPNPEVPTPYVYNSAYDDPTFTICTGSGADAVSANCKDSWGLRIVGSSDVLIYGTGMYSFFENYGQDCLVGEDCQQHMIRIQHSQVDMYAVSTKASVYMITDDNGRTVLDADNRAAYCATIAYYFTEW